MGWLMSEVNRAVTKRVENAEKCFSGEPDFMRYSFHHRFNPETRKHLPYFVATIKEGLRMHPPATTLFARVVPKEGK
ncbi:hypothetical protein SNOG_09862 [Parastagonospora nodorum SN15]|uniref:Uncharacterized protein n=1 Tax=Phaeosphaeria nodorum (strain SN15 / ATCC MYA-4574 / FGSC 10173) TaxID=321614 RepID=Q0UEF2_PHANO|nr:hypothetical protein SNOG_09862 [Parastagonospora nodorum SN15]EAT83127.1 hypothetical protein SNOG_09862 [Parastagonospora nodorum SN15]